MAAPFHFAQLITNPAARQGRARLPPEWFETSPADVNGCLSGTRLERSTPQSSNKIPALVQSAVEQGADLIVAAGGDGTAHMVVNALMQVPENQRPTFTVLPLGTGNDFAKMLGLKKDATSPLRALNRGKVERVDLGRCGQTWFLNDMGTGLFSEATRIYYGLPRLFTGISRYVTASLGAIAQPWRCNLTLTVDGEIRHDGPFAFLAISNGAWTGGRFLMNPEGSIRDGLLDVWLCGPMSKLDLLRNLPKLPKGTHAQHPAIHHYRAKTVQVESHQLEIFQLDGELQIFPKPSLSIEVVPQALRVLSA